MRQSDEYCIAEVPWSRRGDYFCRYTAVEGEEYCGRHLKLAEATRAYRTLVKSLVDEVLGTP